MEIIAPLVVLPMSSWLLVAGASGSLFLSSPPVPYTRGIRAAQCKDNS